MVGYKLVYTKQANKDAKKLNQSGLKDKAKYLLEIISKLNRKFLIFSQSDNSSIQKVARCKL
jgi:hypothetical protein